MNLGGRGPPIVKIPAVLTWSGGMSLPFQQDHWLSGFYFNVEECFERRCPLWHRRRH